MSFKKLALRWRANYNLKEIAPGHPFRQYQTDKSAALLPYLSKVAQVESGVVVATGTGKSILDINAMVGKLAVAMDNISLASAEQMQGISQVSIAVNEMDGVTQNNAALVEEITDVISRTFTALFEISFIVSDMRCISCSPERASAAVSRAESAVCCAPAALLR